MKREFTEWEWQQIHSAQNELTLFYRFWVRTHVAATSDPVDVS